MCGIVGAVTHRKVTGILLEGLQRLEYRGYDSAGLALFDGQKNLQRLRRVGKVQELRSAHESIELEGVVGIAHTRWATHGKPSSINAHPQASSDLVAVVHNGIIENHEILSAGLKKLGYEFESETDTEVIAHLVHKEVASHGDFKTGVQSALAHLQGAYAIAVIHKNYPDSIIAARVGSPLVVGLGIGENFIASDPQALRPVTDRFIFLEEGELVELTAESLSIVDLDNQPVERHSVVLDDYQDTSDKGEYRHYMMKEIHEQPDAILATLDGRVTDKHVLENCFGVGAGAIFEKTQAIQIVAC